MMKKILFATLLALTATGATAQSAWEMVVTGTNNATQQVRVADVSNFGYAKENDGWKMTITKTDGTTIEARTADIRDIAYQQVTLADQNADQIIIKEIYCGGCPMLHATADKDVFHFDSSFILYNNCPQKAVLNNLCFGEAQPANAHATNDWYTLEGKLIYEDRGYIPVWHGLWYLTEPLEIAPYSQVVINVYGAIDNTQTEPNSINYANPAYYCMYDPESGYTHTSYYPTPSDKIPASHYLKAVEIGLGSGWGFSISSPALVMFQTPTAPAEFAANADNMVYPGGLVSQTYACFKVPRENIIDGVEVFSVQYKEKGTSKKRLTADIDGGYVWLTWGKGHTLYRNVDKEATEALPENNGKLVYNYALGVDDSTDPSGIDAEASIKNGAHIIYMDTNNSSVDFHERQKSSLRTEATE